MAHMLGGGALDVGSAGTRLRQKVLLGLALSSALPLLVLVYVLHAYVRPTLDASRIIVVFGLETLAFLTLVAVAAGASILWGLGRTVARMADLMAQVPTAIARQARTDEIGELMTSFSRMLETIEQQATEINSFATRLDTAYRELESSNAKLKETSFKDEVTGLYNRRFFTIRLEEEIARHRRFNHPVSIVLLDLDGFKAVNDEFGHAVGDETLCAVAATLTKHSRRINVVSRYGGDEFAVLLVETSKAGARVYAERIRELIAATTFPHGKRITASLGVASLPDDDAATTEALFKVADEALYAAKRAGKDQVGSAEREGNQGRWNDARS